MKTLGTKIHYNRPQIRSMLVGAPVEILIAGRGTGKTEGVLAPKSVMCYLDPMPRATGVIVGVTYNQILTRTLPGLVKGWEMLGYKRDVHFVVGKAPTDAWKKQWAWKGPYRMPFKFHYCISWWNGAIIYLVSQDIIGSSNGITIDWIIGDEAKFLNQQRFNQELLPANRGIIPAFKNIPYHHGITLTTDMPTGTGGLWLLEMESKCNQNKVRDILKIQKIISFLRGKKVLKSEEKNKELQLKVLNDELMELRRGLVLYHEASSLENIHALGIDYFKQQLTLTTSFEFDTQILNLKMQKTENGFYPDFDEELHGYYANNNSFLEGLQYDFNKIENIDCRRDADLQQDDEIHIAIDYNRRIHPLVAVQENETEIKVIRAHDVLYPKKLKNVVEDFCEYYRYKKRKSVCYWYDQTAVGEQHDMRICDEVVRILRKRGWAVKRMYMGLAPSHMDKYNMYGHLLTNDGKYEKELRINRENCPYLIRSINLAPAEHRKDGYGKLKLSERDPKFPARDSTHYSDALDMIIWGLLESRIKSRSATGGSLLTGLN